MKYYKMTWGDVIRMDGDFRFPANTFEHLEFAPSKEDYKEHGSPAILSRTLIASFRASSKKFSVRKWVIEEIGVPSALLKVRQSKSRWNIDFIKVEEEVKKVIKVVEEVKEEEIILEEEKE